MPLFGPPNVEKLEARKDVNGLIKALDYQKDVDVRRAAAEALGKIGDVRASDPLAAVIEDEAVRMTAAHALAALGDVRGVEPLVAALGDVTARRSAAESLERLRWVPGNDESGARYFIALGDWRACAKIGKPAVKPLLDELWRSGHANEYTVSALGDIGDPLAVEPLVKLLELRSHPYATLRKAAIRSLGQIGGPRAVEALIAVLKEKEHARVSSAAWEIAEKARKALVEIGTPAIEPLVSLFEHADYFVRKDAAQALGELGWQPSRDAMGAVYWIMQKQWDRCVEIGEPAVEPLIAALQDGLADVRQAAAEALGRIADSRAVNPLIAELKSGNLATRRAAAQALLAIYQRGGLSEQQRRQVLAARGTITEPHVHVDETTHDDNGGYSCIHSDGSSHEDTDSGIGVDWPV